MSHYRLTKIQICFDSGEAFSGTAHYLLGEKLSALILETWTTRMS